MFQWIAIFEKGLLTLDVLREPTGRRSQTHLGNQVEERAFDGATEEEVRNLVFKRA